MSTYKEIQEYVKSTFGYMPKTCSIAHSKEINCLSPKLTPLFPPIQLFMY